MTKRKNELLDKAIGLIEEKGWTRFSMRELARRAGFSTPSSMYEHFKNKQDLLESLARRELNALSFCSTDLNALGMEYISFALEHPETFKTIFSARLSDRKTAEDPVRIDSLYSKLLKILAEETQQSPERLEYLAFTYWTVLHGIAMLRLTNLKDFDRDQFAKLQHFAIETVTAALRGHSPKKGSEAS